MKKTSKASSTKQTKAKQTNEVSSNKEIRVIKISTIRRKHSCMFINEYLEYPYIRFSGEWLEEAGFKKEQSVCIEVQNKKLIITPLKY